VHISLNIWQLVATILMILLYFVISEQHRKVKIKKSRGGNASSCLNVVTPMQKATKALVDSITAFSTLVLLYTWQCIS